MIVVRHDNSGISKLKLYSAGKKLLPEVRRISKVGSYDSEFASVHLPYDKTMLSAVNACISEKQKLRPSLIVVIGIGGSNLGTKAVFEALSGKQWNLLNNPKVLFADTVDPDSMTEISNAMKHELRQGNQVLLNVISKSGSTAETVANFEVLLNVLKRHRKDASKYVVVTTDKDSKLWNLGLKNKFSLLEIPKNVGGRYSVFSPVGLFPLGVAGINIDKLLEGAKSMRQLCAVEDVKKNPALLEAVSLYLNYKNRKNIYNHFFFANDFEALGRWYCQLLAESIGKEFDDKKKKVNVGITPITSIGSTDLHSMAQLYLGGPDDKFTNFVTVNFNNKVHTPGYNEFNELVGNIQKTELAQIMKAIANGTKIAYKKKKLHFIETKFDFRDEFNVGAFMQLKMIKTMLLAKIFNVNPFNQPNVELYKYETRKLLMGK